MSPTFVLMYHRVCPRTDANAPWFARGTAVTPEAFARQIRWLADRFEWINAADVHALRDRAAVAITFDDGYADVIDHAAPICAELGIRATCFASAGPVLERRALWFDVWYATASRLNVAVEEWFAAQGLSVPASPEDWARGPAKAWLASQPRARRLGLIRDLAGLRDAPDAPRYVTPDDLDRLTRSGWSIGGHGVDHYRLTDVDDATATSELRGSDELLNRIGARRPRVFAYPDGAYNAAVRGRVREAGFEIAYTVETGAVTPETDPFAVPRLFARGDGPVPHPMLCDFIGGA